MLSVDLNPKRSILGGGKVPACRSASLLESLRLTTPLECAAHGRIPLSKSGDLMVCPVFPANAGRPEIWPTTIGIYEDTFDCGLVKTFTLVWYPPPQNSSKGAAAV